MRGARFGAVVAVGAALLLTGLAPVYAATAPKPGSVCKPAGAKRVVAGKTYTCVKSGKRLVWSKGIAAPATVTAASERAGASCVVRGLRVTNAAGFLECRDVAQGKREWMQLSTRPASLAYAPSPSPMTTCRVPDARITRVQQFPIAYPVPSLLPTLPNRGVNKIAVIPVDFADAKGATPPSAITDRFVREITAWMKWFTNDRLRFDLQVGKTWLRAPKPSAAYNWIHPGLGRPEIAQLTPQQINQELVDLADDTFDFTDVGAVFFIYPENVVDIYDAATAFGQRIVTDEGSYTVGTYATGKWLYESKLSVSMWFLHELEHAWGFAGHSPAYPNTFSIFHNQSGVGQNINTWEAMSFDWIRPEQVWCADLTAGWNVPAEVTLVPQEREQEGTQAVMVKLGPSRVLVVESHRQDTWGRAWPNGFYGVAAYVVDTRFDVDRRGEFNGGNDDGRGTAYTRFANYLTLSTAGHGMLQLPRLVNGDGYQTGPLDLDLMLYMGESFTFEGVKVTLVRSGDNDTVRVERAQG